jgi:serralysin
MANLNGTAGNDVLVGDDANSSGVGGDDTIHGGGGDDVIDGRGGTNHVFGDDGDDTIRLGTEPTNSTHAYTYADGGAGNDTLELTGIHAFRVDTNSGHDLDVKEYDDADGSLINLAAASNVESISVKSDNVSLDLSAFLDPLTVNGYGESTNISTGAGNDVINVKGISDAVVYNGGNDVVSFEGSGGVFLIGHVSAGQHDVQVTGSLYDLVVTSGVLFNKAVTVDLASHMATIEGTSFHLPDVNQVVAETPQVSVTVLGSAVGDQMSIGQDIGQGWSLIDGRAGNDSILAIGAVTVSGGAGSDHIQADGGHEWINGDGSKDASALAPSSIAGGSDYIIGGYGNDHIFGNAQFMVAGTADGDDTVFAGSGSDYVNGNAGADHVEGGAGSDRLYGGAGDDMLFGDSEADPSVTPGNDHINGNKGNDTIWGGGGNDDLHGGQDDDRVRGGDGNDSVSGDAGNDFVIGGLGFDTLTGGAGRDWFTLTETDKDAAFSTTGPGVGLTDVIADFSPGGDYVDLNFLPVAILTGSQGSFAGAASMAQQLLDGHAGDHEVAAVQVGSDTYLFFSATGGGTVDSAVDIAGVAASALHLNDFA